MLGLPLYYGLRGHSLGLTISFIAGLDFLLFGYDQGVTGGIVDLESFIKHFPDVNINETYKGIVVSAYNLGCFIGSIFTIFIGNSLGRKKTIFFGSFIMIIGAILQCTSFQLSQLIVGRLVTGWGNGMNTSTVPMWQSETAQSHQRGKLVMIEGALITAGITISYWVNYGFAWIGNTEVAWRFPLAFQIFFAIIICMTILNLPESPRWLVMQGRTDEALEVLESLTQRAQSDPYLQAEFTSIQETVIEMSRGSFRSLFDMTEYREFHRVTIAYVSQMFQQISGINLITYYAPTLYQQINLNYNQYPKLLSACNGTEYLMSAILPIFIVEKIGRRPLMLFGAAGMSASMAVLAGTKYRFDVLHDNQAGIGHAVFLFVFNTFFGIGWLGMTWLYPAEIVPLRIRAPTTALSTSGNWIFNFMVVMIAPPAFASIGYKTYVIFAVINFAIFPTVWFFFPETRYRSLEEMDDIFKKSTNVLNVVTIANTEPHRYDKDGNLRPEFKDWAAQHGLRDDKGIPPPLSKDGSSDEDGHHEHV